MISAVNMTDVTVCNESRSDDQAMYVSQCLFWELFSQSGVQVAVFFTIYFALLIASVAMNCYLLYLPLKLRRRENPHYIILQNQAVCSMLIAITSCIYLLPNVLQGRTATLSYFSVSFVGIMGGFLLASQMFWALIAVERYIFVCHGLHYLRITSGHVIHQALGAIWAVVCLLNINYAVVISRSWHSDDKPIDALFCDPSVFEKYAELTSIGILQFHGPPSIIMVVSIVTILTCYSLMFRAAYNVAVELQQSYQKAVRTTSFYLFVIFVHMLPMIYAVVNQPAGHLLQVFLTTVTPFVNAAVPLSCISEFRNSLFSHPLPVQGTEIQLRRRIRLETAETEFQE